MKSKSAPSVHELMRRWPASIRVFIDNRLLCPGCPFARIHTLEDACREHGVEIGPVYASLERSAPKAAARCRELSASLSPARFPRARRGRADS